MRQVGWREGKCGWLRFTLPGLLAWLLASANPHVLAQLPLPGNSLPLQLPVSGYGLVTALGGLTFDHPVALVAPPGERDRLFVVERPGRIIVVSHLRAPSASVFLDVTSTTYSAYLEAGLLGLAFHPGYQTNGYFYVYRTVARSTPGNINTLHQQVSRFQTSRTDPNLGLPESEQPLIAQVDNSPEHNGGDLQFGPDGYLYISLGDDGPPLKDRSDRPQPLDGGFFGGIARIDVDQRPGSLPPNPSPASSPLYSIPSDNPFIGITEYQGVKLEPSRVRTEFYAIGLRNPWRISFDPATGRLFCGDVGAAKWEEIDLINKGGDYGWPYLEGNEGTPPTNVVTIPPLLAYDHGYGSRQGMAVMGGVVYGGQNIPALRGEYVFGDFVSGNIWSLRINNESASVWRWLTAERGVAAFGSDPSNGDILVANHTTGLIRRLVYVDPETVHSIPQTLQDTGLFSDLAALQVQAGLIPYSVNVPFWSDDAIKSRWFGLPANGARMQFAQSGNWQFPPGTVWVKHFELETTKDVPSTRRRLETRVLVKSDDGVYGLTYRWGNSVKNAVLVPPEGLSEPFLIHEGGTVRTQVWHYPSRAECLYCHTPQAGFALGFNTLQLNLNEAAPNGVSQLESLRAAGCFASDAPIDVSRLPRLATPTETSYPLGYRARSYLHANCSQCHQPGAPADGSWDARLTTPLADAHIVDAQAVFGLDDTVGLPIRVIAPHSVQMSMLIQWMNRRGVLQMPPMSTDVVDTNGVKLLTEWVNSFPPAPWRDTNFGSTNLQGYTAADDNGFVVSASAGPPAGDTASCYFVFAPLQDNGQFVVHLAEFNPGSQSALAGVMGRIGLDEQGLFLAVLQAGNGAMYLRRRPTPGADIEILPIGTAGPTPWLRLVREESNLVAYFSNDRASWSVAGSLALTGNPAVCIGPAVVPGESVAFSTATFKQLELFSVVMTAPGAGTFITPGLIPITATVNSLYQPPSKVEFMTGLQQIGEVTNAPFTLTWANPAAGMYPLRARVTDQFGATVSTDPITLIVALAAAVSRFHQEDAVTRGNWKGVYGMQGWAIPGGDQFFKPGIDFDVGVAQKEVLSPAVADESALQASDGDDRIASRWTAPQTLSVQLSLNDGELHQVAFYFADWDHSATRAQEVHLFDSGSGKLLESKTVSDFSGGKYLVWTVRGRARIDIVGLTELPVLLSGVFVSPALNQPPAVTLHPLGLDKAPLPAELTFEADAVDPDGAISRVEFYDGPTFIGSALQPPYRLGWSNGTVGVHQITARAFDDLDDYANSAPEQIEFEAAPAGVEFIGVDDATSGSWKSLYGKFAIAGLVTNYPPAVSVDFEQASLYVWAEITDFPQALQRPTDVWRTASSWFGDQIALRVDCADGLWHDLALYFLDWDSGGRIQTVSIIDPSSGTVLDSRTVSQFSSGLYYTWKVRGSVQIQIQAQIMNAVLSGLFFEPLPPQPLILTWVGSGLGVKGPPGRAVKLNFSSDLKSWSLAGTNTLSADGTLLLPVTIPSDLTARFYQVELVP
jgi:glucose/arabinose dehydrogenase